VELLPTFTWYGTSISPTFTVLTVTHLRMVSDDEIHQFLAQRGELFRVKIACKLLEARVKQRLLYFRLHLHLSH
jgi:hypothetical protein